MARGGRGRPGRPPPAPARAARAAGARRLDQRGRPELRVRAPDGAARRGVRRRDLLRDVQRGAEAADASSTSATTSPAARTARPGSATSSRPATDRRAPCWGTPRATGRGRGCGARASAMCERAPPVLVQRAGPRARDHEVSGLEDADAVDHEGTLPGAYADLDGGSNGAEGGWPAPQARGDRSGLRLLRRIGVVDPASFDDYRAHGGYEALRRAVELGAEGTIREVTDAKLLGRGGAAFPTGVKWKAVAEQPVHPHYFVCNADESEPGTFKDRVVMEHDPFAVIEALTIAGYATGSERGYIYIRGRVPARDPAPAPRDRGGAAPRVPRRRRDGGGLPRSTSSCVVGRAPTSAVRRRRSSTRSKASGASRGTSRPSRCSAACSASPPASTTSRRC